MGSGMRCEDIAGIGSVVRVEGVGEKPGGGGNAGGACSVVESGPG
jgi:hypothetical protein